MPTLQNPIHSDFNAASTAAEVMAGVDLTGKIAIVTGGYSGIGLVTTKSLAAAGAHVIVPARDPVRALAALAEVKRVEVLEMDLMQPASVEAFSRRMLNSGRPISLLINCAGVMASPLTRDGDGHESQFATNHLGHYRLTCGLWPALIAAGAARVVSVSSRGHQIAGVDFDDIDFCAGHTTSGWRTVSRKPPTHCLRWRSTNADVIAACGHSRCTRGKSDQPRTPSEQRRNSRIRRAG